MLPELGTSRPTLETGVLTFTEAFNCKQNKLAEELDVSDELLHKLNDAKIINAASCERIKKIQYNADKVDELLHVIERRDDSLLPDFCKILRDLDQLNVVKLILPDGHYLRDELIPDELTTELMLTTEPRYRLLGDLLSKQVIDRNQHMIITEETSADDRVLRLIQAVRQSYGHVKVELFLQALEENDQPHVVNFINTDGKLGVEFGDVRPLNEQQRRRLWLICDEFAAMDLQEGRFLDLLRARGVISALQQDDVLSKKSRNESIQLLLEILERRSLANLNQFIECLNETKQSSIVQWLKKEGAVARLRSTIDQPEMSVENELMAVFEKLTDECNHQNKNDLAFRLRELMENNGYKITCAKRKNSIAWYVMCYSEDKLELLRWLYESPCRLLFSILQCIFTRTCGRARSQRLSIKWTSEDYENCMRYLIETSGRPFDMLKCCGDAGEPSVVPDFTVSFIVWKIIFKI
jgi:hypothetical protein